MQCVLSEKGKILTLAYCKAWVNQENLNFAASKRFIRKNLKV
jgi:hypothetical protein